MSALKLLSLSEPINVLADVDMPFTCVLCGARTQSFGPKVDTHGEGYYDEQCMSCGQNHHYYEDDTAEAEDE